jgi:hypothetical protein
MLSVCVLCMPLGTAQMNGLACHAFGSWYPGYSINSKNAIKYSYKQLWGCCEHVEWHKLFPTVD